MNAASPSLSNRLARRWSAWLAELRGTAPAAYGLHGPRADDLHRLDWTLIAVTMALVALGLVMVYSASVAMPDNPRFVKLSSTHFLLRQLIALAGGTVLAAICLRLPVSLWERLAPWMFVASLVLLMVVVVPLFDKINGARRWIPLGFVNFQPSELAKLAMALYAAHYMVRKMDVKERFVKAVLPMAAALAVVGLLLLAEPDMGAFMVIAAIALGILFLGGVNGRVFFLSLAILLLVFVVIIATSDFRRERILGFLDPFNPKFAKTRSYQLTHSLIALGRGDWFGQGLGSSVEKLHYLPEAHTDFLLAVIGEELGFFAVLAVIVAFFWLIRRFMAIGSQAISLDRLFAGLMAQGIAVWFGAQSFINMGVNLGVLPTKGLTLPLLSYGGSGLVFNLIALAVVLRVDQENRQLMRGGRG